MAKNTPGKSLRASRKRGGKLSMSARLRAAYQTLADGNWDLNTVSNAEVVAMAKKGLKGAVRANFNPTPAQVSIVKREFTGGSCCHVQDPESDRDPARTWPVALTAQPDGILRHMLWGLFLLPGYRTVI